MGPARRLDPLRLVGQTLEGKYRVEGYIGQGGFGLVYRALHTIWNQPVALKCFRGLSSTVPERREQLLHDFVQEGALLSELSARCASIVQARDIGTFTTEQGEWVPYMVLEWLDGVTVEEVLSMETASAGSPVPWSLDRVLATLEPVAIALEVAHRRGVAHRDIKPGNIFLVEDRRTRERSVKLLDFGIAKVVQQAQEKSYTKTNSDEFNSFTPNFGAPEQFSRKYGATGPWTDVFALALVFTGLVLGREPLDGDDYIQLATAVCDPALRPTPAAFGVHVPPALEAVLARAMAIMPQERYASAGEFWTAVRMSLGLGTLADLSGGGGVALSAQRLGYAQGGPAPAGANAAGMGGAAAPGVPSPRGRPSGRVAPSLRSIRLAAGLGVASALTLLVLLVSRACSGPGPAGDPTTPAASDSGAQVETPPPSKPSCPSDMVALDGGEFRMGTDDGEPDEFPPHLVTVNGFCLDRHEVTVAQYQQCVKIGDCKPPPTDVQWPGMSPREKKIYSPACNGRDAFGKDLHPINCIDWETANLYCQWAGKRLPTEAEWEYAARGPEGRRYPWGNEPPDATRLNACGSECAHWLAQHNDSPATLYARDDKWALTAPVGSFPRGKTPQGVEDLAGNVWEWTADWSGLYPSDPQVAPKGPPKGVRKVVRGGGFNADDEIDVRTSQRYSNVPDTRTALFGFRCARDK
ncbi:MAG TPA: bifunctional serine/threonine-protein kinase/formylglycine-generating enzyme family protein [Polyangiaceae bacterium]|nr:bifunctional serine/threonine-protein kinase/formylglycine-generating enzyme family protein [Polyangiaceae bacterium]